MVELSVKSQKCQVQDLSCIPQLWLILIKTLVEKFYLYNLIVLLKIVFYSNPEIRGEETSLLAINIKEPHEIKNLLNQNFWSR